MTEEVREFLIEDIEVLTRSWEYLFVLEVMFCLFLYGLKNYRRIKEIQFF